MRPRCKCGNIAGYWYSPMVYVRMRVDQYLNAHCYCASCADVDNWGEYEYVGFHKKDWMWLKLKGVEYNVNVRDAWMDKPYYTVSHLIDGVMWYYGIVRDKEELKELEKTLVGVEWEEEWYRDTREEQWKV